MDDIPDEWEAPIDLQTPTPYPEVNIAIKLLSCDFLGFEVRVAVGRFVREEAQYDIWYLKNAASAGWDDRKLALLREVPMEQTRDVYEVWKRLEDLDTLNLPNSELRERRTVATAEIVIALERAADTFLRTRDGTVEEG
ncbi:hypothetical protein [Jidongwangia harbinensis]|uniref:hypothetical protein n=1 Tax=Jidongwangia harbinensis TaxID=2878561 RepID=UPI001CD93DB8|nr:hypothetical protein [Jidongwangia harbinensis]MCA2213466.1 hypothetical protein [Jidongwangia harbinensis]